jgi:hypothetical protein
MVFLVMIERDKKVNTLQKLTLVDWDSETRARLDQKFQSVWSLQKSVQRRRSWLHQRENSIKIPEQRIRNNNGQGRNLKVFAQSRHWKDELQRLPDLSNTD